MICMWVYKNNFLAFFKWLWHKALQKVLLRAPVKLRESIKMLISNWSLIKNVINFYDGEETCVKDTGLQKNTNNQFFFTLIFS